MDACRKTERGGRANSDNATKRGWQAADPRKETTPKSAIIISK